MIHKLCQREKRGKKTLTQKTFILHALQIFHLTNTLTWTCIFLLSFLSSVLLITHKPKGQLLSHHGPDVGDTLGRRQQIQFSKICVWSRQAIEVSECRQIWPPPTLRPLPITELRCVDFGPDTHHGVAALVLSRSPFVSVSAMGS